MVMLAICSKYHLVEEVYAFDYKRRTDIVCDMSSPQIFSFSADSASESCIVIRISTASFITEWVQ
jgi:hypothetical protein